MVISDYFEPFQETFLQQFYDSNFPPRKIFPNSKSCASVEVFITDTIMMRVRNGSLTVIGTVGEVEPPHLVLPITIEPKKPRLCHDERFLNLWIEDCPFTLDYITDLPRYVDQDHYQTTFDDKSGYHHIQLHPSTIPDKKVGTASKLSPLPTYNVDNRVFFSLFVGRNEIFSNID